MAFNKYNLVVNTLGRNEQKRILNYKSSTDNLATIKASAYFNTASSSTPLRIGDIVNITASDGSTTLRIAAISPNVTTVEFGLAS